MNPSVVYKSFPNAQRVTSTADCFCSSLGLPETQKFPILDDLIRQNGVEWLAKHSGSQKEEGVKSNFQSEIWKGQEQRSESEVCSVTLEVRVTGWKKHTLLIPVSPQTLQWQNMSWNGQQ